MSDRKRTPLYPVYQDKAKLVSFAGWEMPVQFSGIKNEHQAVRHHAGLFDVSHMGEIAVSGPGAIELLQRLTTNDVTKLKVGKAQYTFMCYPNGGTIDDFVIYQIGEQTYQLVVNAVNTENVLQWIQDNNQEGVEVTNLSSAIAQIAIQGPKAETIVQKLTDTDLSRISFFHFHDAVDLNGIQVLVSRSGYTGEDGFELYLSAEKGAVLWQKLLEIGEEHGLIPCGLGARDTLRLEACLPLYGQELSEDISPVEAGLGFAVKAIEKTFIGSDILKQQLTQGPPRKLVGLEMVERGIPRTGYPVWSNDEEIGVITSGTHSPTLGKNLGLALIQSPYAQLDNEVQVEIRGKKVKAKIVKKPFYRRK